VRYIRLNHMIHSYKDLPSIPLTFGFATLLAR
jgi:hypothetical protein